MLFLLFQVGKDRYVLDASRVVEVVPLLELKSLRNAPKGLAGIFNYRGRPLLAVDLCELLLDAPSSERFSTRIIIIRFPDGARGEQIVGLIAEHATQVIRKEPSDFAHTGIPPHRPPYLGPIMIQGNE